MLQTLGTMSLGNLHPLELLREELIECCGGKMASKCMLPLLEKLSMVEETVIREAAMVGDVSEYSLSDETVAQSMVVIVVILYWLKKTRIG